MLQNYASIPFQKDFVRGIENFKSRRQDCQKTEFITRSVEVEALPSQLDLDPFDVKATGTGTGTEGLRW